MDPLDSQEFTVVANANSIALKYKPIFSNTKTNTLLTQSVYSIAVAFPVINLNN